MTETLKVRVYVKSLKWVLPVKEINFSAEEVEVDLSMGQGDTSVYTFEEVIFMKWTGLTDRFGRSIYEGDYIEIASETSEGFFKNETFEVVWEKEQARFSLKTNGRILPELNQFFRYGVVLGNIYEGILH